MFGHTLEFSVVEILTHGSDMTTATTIGPIVRQYGVSFRTVLQRLSRAGVQAIQLDATLRGLRPQELDQAGRRSLKALLARSDVRVAGMDQFLPRRHFLDSAEQDRAVHATLDAIGLAADLGRIPLSIALPVADTPDEILHAVVEAADSRSQPVAVHCEEQAPALSAWLERIDHRLVGASVDAAAILAAGEDPIEAVHRISGQLLVGRLSDMSEPAAAGGMRCATGDGMIDLRGYRVAIDLCPARLGPVVIDVRGVANPGEAALRSIKAWDDASFSL